MKRQLPVLAQPCCCPGSPPLESGHAEALAGRFKALADPSRVAIVNRLAGAEEVCVCDFTGTLGLAQPTVSHHLKVLRQAGLVEVARKRGTWVYYRLVPEAVGELAFALGGKAVAAAAWSRRACCSCASRTPGARRWRKPCTSGAAARRARPGRRRPTRCTPRSWRRRKRSGSRSETAVRGRSRGRTSSGPSSS